MKFFINMRYPESKIPLHVTHHKKWTYLLARGVIIMFVHSRIQQFSICIYSSVNLYFMR